MCGEHEIAPRLIQDLLENFSGRCWPRSPREIIFPRNSGKFQKQILPNWVHRRPFRQSLAGIFGNFKLLAFHCHRSKDPRHSCIISVSPKSGIPLYIILPRVMSPWSSCVAISVTRKIEYYSTRRLWVWARPQKLPCNDLRQCSL